MKYTIQGFSQKTVMKLGLDVVDIMLLRYFIDFKDGGSMVKSNFDNETYYWVNYENVIKELPILKLNKSDSVYRRFKKMSDLGILDHKTKKEKGTFSFFKVGHAYIELISDTTNINPDPYGYKSSPGTDINPQQKINLLNDSFIKIYTFWNEQNIIEHKKLNEKMKRVISTCLKDHEEEEIVQAIRNYKKILIEADYYFSYKWTLEEFLKRGLDRFLHWEVCSSNFRNKEKSCVFKATKVNASAYEEI